MKSRREQDLDEAWILGFLAKAIRKDDPAFTKKAISMYRHRIQTPDNLELFDVITFAMPAEMSSNDTQHRYELFIKNRDSRKAVVRNRNPVYSVRQIRRR